MQFDPFTRREFIPLLGAAIAWPFSAARPMRAHARERNVSVLMNTAMETDQKAGLAQFVRALAQRGWRDGANVRIDVRWAGGQANEIGRSAAELAAQAPDVIVATGTGPMKPLMKSTRTIPIVFINVADPVGAGLVNSLARPGGNATGFLQFEYTLSGKWLELLKQVAPNVKRAAVLRDADLSAGIGQYAAIESVAPALGIEVTAVNMHDAAEMEQAVAAFARSPNGGLILTASALAVVRRDLIIGLAARYKLPAVYYRRYFVDMGGLVSHGYDIDEQYRCAAGYVDRILRGAKPADLPVQAPARYELVINLKTAKALRLDIPATMQARADDVIE